MRAPCRSEDVVDSFFLHVFPVAAEGFDNLDFNFSNRGIIDSQRCAVAVELPDYDIASIRTGQYGHSDEGQIWTVEFGLASG